jgi:hypothetical protein
MAAVLPPVPVPAAAPAAPGLRSYRAYYDDAGNDLYLGHYDAVVARFSADPVVPAVAATPAELADSVYATTLKPGPAFLLYCRPHFDPAGTATPRIQLFHRLTKYGGTIGLPTVWDGTGFAYVGDVIPPHADIVTVVWQQNLFHRTGAMRVQHLDVFNQALAADPDAVTFGPFGAADAATTDVHRVRTAAYVPHRYVNLFLGEELTPREACERAAAAIAADGLTDTLSDLLFWLRSTMTIQVVGAETPLLIPYPTIPMPDANLTGHRRHFLFTDLPALGGGAVGEGATLIAGAVGALAEQNRQFREADEVRQEERKAAEAKTPDTFLGSAVQTLLRLAQVATAANLPHMWHDLAGSTKKAHQRNIIQMAMDEALDRVSPGGGWAYIVTPSVAKKITGLEFRMSNPDNLSTGIQPFILVQTSPSEKEAAETLVHAYDIVMGGASASATDAHALVSNDPAILPSTLLQARASLQVFQAIVLMTLGEDHAWTQGLHQFVQRFNSREIELEQLKTRDTQYRNVVPALLVRWIQLRWNDWLQSQWSSMVDVPVPNLLALFSDIRVGAAWEPPIPAQYLRLPTVTAPAVSRSGETGGNPARQPAAGGGRAGTEALGAQNAVVRNTTYAESDFGIYRDRPRVIIRILLEQSTADPPPISSNDSPANRGRFPNSPLRVCLSYHVKGMCNTRCGRAADHGPLTAEKRQEILTWCVAHWVSPPPAAPT